MELLYVCSWCVGKKKYKSSVDGVWKDITPKVLRMIVEAPDQISHGICPDCARKLSKELDEEERKKKGFQVGQG